MKRSHIIGIVIIAVAIATIIGSITDSSTYASFKEAFRNKGTSYHVVGTLDRDKEVVYNPEENPELVKFHLEDRKGNTRKVHLHMAKPRDFERSENIVLIGEAREDAFHASDMLMKCPSKYNDKKKVASGGS